MRRKVPVPVRGRPVSLAQAERERRQRDREFQRVCRTHRDGAVGALRLLGNAAVVAATMDLQRRGEAGTHAVLVSADTGTKPPAGVAVCTVVRVVTLDELRAVVASFDASEASKLSTPPRSGMARVAVALPNGVVVLDEPVGHSVSTPRNTGDVGHGDGG